MNKSKNKKISIVLIIILILIMGFFFYVQFKPKPKVEKIKILEPISVDDFDKGATKGVFYERINSLGGYQGTWAKRPSYSLIFKSTEHRLGDTGKGLIIQYKKEAGWCGWYTLLQGIDASHHNILSFWVKGKEGSEKFDIGLADSRMQELEIDAVYLGCINAFLETGVTKEWQKVKIPLSRIVGKINLNSLGSMVLWFKYGGEGTIYLEDIKFEHDLRITEIEKLNMPHATFDKRHPRAIWVWKVDPVNNLEARSQLFDFCKQAGIGIVYLYFEKLSPQEMSSDNLRDFLKQAHKKRLKIEALTGNPTWALKEKHTLALDWVKSFLEYNKLAPTDSHFDGVSLDIEPYLAREWEVDRESIKKEYLELLGKTRELIDEYNKEYKDDFKLGVAIPVFYDREDYGEFERKIFELVDYCALMAYYDNAKDIIENTKTHIKFAEKAKKGLYVGLETQDLVTMQQGLRRNTFFEEGWKRMEFELSEAKKEFIKSPSFKGFAIHCYDSYWLLQKGRNVPTKERPVDIFKMVSFRKIGDLNIDGKLDDWNLEGGLTIVDEENVVHGQGAWKDKEDLSYQAFSQWDEKNLYFAFIITDDTFIQQKRAHQMWEGDHVELWLDVDLKGDYNEAVNSEDDLQIGLSPGNFININPESYIWTPSLDIDYSSLIKIASSKTDDGYIIEAKIPKVVLYLKLSEVMEGLKQSDEKMDTRTIHYEYSLQQSSQLEIPDNFMEGMTLGINVDIGDCDNLANPQEFLMSSSTERIWGDPTTFGYLELK